MVYKIGMALIALGFKMVSGRERTRRDAKEYPNSLIGLASLWRQLSERRWYDIVPEDDSLGRKLIEREANIYSRCSRDLYDLLHDGHGGYRAIVTRDLKKYPI